MRFTITFAVLSAFASPSGAIPGLTSTYACSECHGLLEVKNIKSEIYSAKLAIGGVSCGGEVVAKGKGRLSKANELNLPYTLSKKRCILKISFTNNGADVADSCMMPEMEGHSTCAALGEYKKQ